MAAVALLSAGCSGGGYGSSTSPSTVKQGGVLRLGTTQGIDSPNPFVGFSQDLYSTLEYIYPHLVEYDGKLQIVPSFATSWKASSDGKTWTFQTRQDAVWSDGRPLTAEDAAFTINMIVKYQKGPTSLLAASLAHAISARATSPNTLVLSYDQAVSNVLPQIQQFPILPEHVWSKFATGKGTGLKSTPMTLPVVSGGPFILTQYKKNDIALFDRNPHFFGTKPHIDGFGLQWFSNADAMLTALKSGQLDAVESVAPTGVSSLKQAGLKIQTASGLKFDDLIINSNPKKPQHRELLDSNVRLALAHAIDMQKIISTAWLGYAQPGTSIIPPATADWHDPSLKPVPFDLNAANQLLDQAGFQRGSDGIRVAGGHPMQYKVIFPQDLSGPGDRTFAIIQSDFRQIGVALSLQKLDNSAAFAAIGAPNYKYLTFDLAMWDWIPLIDPDFILSVLTCDQYGGWSDTGYCNKTYDSVYLQQGTQLNVADRRQTVFKMQDMIYNDRPYIVLNYQDIIEAHSSKWTGFVVSPQGSFNPLSTATMTQVHQV